MGRYPVFMLASTPVILLIGTFLGFLSGLGIGGGSLLILWLTLVLDMDQHTARAINLLFFIPSALAVNIFRWKQGSLNLQTIIPAVISGCIAALWFSLIAAELELTLLKKMLGILLLVTGFRELFYKSKRPPS